MIMLKISCIILSIGECLKLVVSLISFVLTILLNHAPVLKITLDDSEIKSLNEKFLLSTKSLAIMHNSEAAIYSMLILTIIWMGLMKGQRWAFWIVLLSGILAQATWFFSDSFIGNKTLVVNIVFSAIFLIEISLAGIAIFEK